VALGSPLICRERLRVLPPTGRASGQKENVAALDGSQIPSPDNRQEKSEESRPAP